MHDQSNCREFYSDRNKVTEETNEVIIQIILKKKQRKRISASINEVINTRTKNSTRSKNKRRFKIRFPRASWTRLRLASINGTSFRMIWRLLADEPLEIRLHAVEIKALMVALSIALTITRCYQRVDIVAQTRIRCASLPSIGAPGSLVVDPRVVFSHFIFRVATVHLINLTRSISKPVIILPNKSRARYIPER